MKKQKYFDAKYAGELIRSQCELQNRIARLVTLKCTRCGHITTMTDSPAKPLAYCYKGWYLPPHYDCLLGCTHPHGLHLFINFLIFLFTGKPIRGFRVEVDSPLDINNGGLING